MFIRSISNIKNYHYLWLSELLLLVVVIHLNGIETLSLYHRGRYWHGFLGAPSKEQPLEEGSRSKVDDLWYEQQLDHFSATNKETWQQRYFVNADYYLNDSTAPVFLMIGGEAEAAKRWMHEGAWIHYAEHFSALCFQLEHRFYGKSQPTRNLSTTNLQYLSSKQALADVASFVVSMREKYKLGSRQKWIAFGGSYPGSLAAWAREKYPNLIYGAISSSGPLLAKVDFTEYFHVVRNSLASYSTDCIIAIGRGIQQIETMLKHPIGHRNLDKNFKTCTPIENSKLNNEDISSFYENIASNFAGIVQYNKDNSPHSNTTIDEACNIMNNVSMGSPVIRLAAVNDVLLLQAEKTCLDYKYDKMIKDMQQISWSSKVADGLRQWTWQTCNEFGFYQTAENRTDIFGNHFNVNYFVQQCMDIFNDSMNGRYLDEVVEKTNEFYGGLKPTTTNVLYIHGSIDPWHALGLIRTKNPNTPTIYIPGTAHCANMYEPALSDPPQLVAARNKIVKYLADILDQYTMTQSA